MTLDKGVESVNTSLVSSDDDMHTHDLLYATLSRDLIRVEELMQSGIDACSPTKDGTSPIHKAALLESPAGPNIMSRMLSHGADPNKTTPTGLTPLHIAAMWGRVDTVNLLLDSGADPTIKDVDDMSALDYTDEAIENKKECIDALTCFRPSPCKCSDSPKIETQGYVGDISEDDNISISTSTDFFWSPPSSPRESFRKTSNNNSNCCQLSNNCGSPTSYFTPNKTIESNSFRNMKRTLKVQTPEIINFPLQPTCCLSPNISLVSKCNLLNYSDKTTSTTTAFFTPKKTTFDDNTMNSSRIDKSPSIFSLEDSPKSTIVDSDEIISPTSPQTKESSFVVPFSPNKQDNYNILLKISVVSENDIDIQESERTSDSAFNEDFESLSMCNSFINQLSQYHSSTLINESKRYDSNIKRLGQFNDLSTQTELLDLDTEATLNYLSSSLTIENVSKESTLEYNKDDTNNNVKSLIRRIEKLNILKKHQEQQKENDHNLGIDQVDFISSDDKTLNRTLQSPEKRYRSLLRSQKHLDEKKENESKVVDERHCDDTVDTYQNFTCMSEELPNVTVEYDWKDISGIVSENELEETIIVPGSILSMSDVELRARLKSFGESPGPISDITRKLYQKHLVRIEKNNGRQLKPSDKYKDYSLEMKQVLNELKAFSKEDGELLQAEMTLQFTNPEKHTWREGSMKTSFNYLLLDPRVTNNLPQNAKNMSYIEQLRVFMASVFYIGKGKNSRPYEHLHEAHKLEKKEKSNKEPSNKLKMINDIWASGYGVVSLHVFHGIIPVEAYTREGCMIEAIGLKRLTNIKSGDFYGDAGSWKRPKRRELGIFLLSKAMEILIIEGERQIRQVDLFK